MAHFAMSVRRNSPGSACGDFRSTRSGAPGRSSRRADTALLVSCRSLSRFCALLLALLAVASVPSAHAGTQQQHPSQNAILRVCADPNNLPFSNDRGEGFENKLALMLGEEIHAKVEFVWWAERGHLIRNTLQAGRCDALMGLSTGFPSALTTRPYYRSSYVFVFRKNATHRFTSLEDPVLSRVRIGVPVLGDDYAPPAQALARRGVVNITGYSMFGPFGKANPPADLIDAVARGDIDVAIAWGPLAGYFARRQPIALELAPVPRSVDLPMLPFSYDISVAVRSGNQELRDRLDAALQRRRAAVEQLLKSYGVPLIGSGLDPQISEITRKGNR